MEQELVDILKDAIAGQRRKESFESSLGRAVRNHGKDFSVYVSMSSEVRELARSSGIALEDAAREIVSKSEKQA